MKALVTTGPDGPGLTLADAPAPQPASHEALVQLTATSLNRGEVRHLADEEPGTVLGWDVVGTVAQVASDGSGPAVGTRVVGIVGEGGWAEQVAVPTHALAAIPDAVSDAAAAVLPIAGLTAWRALELGGLLLGSRVLVTGAAGGVGRLAVQLANLAGAEVTAVVGRPERRAGLVQLGATDVVVGIDAASARTTSSWSRSAAPRCAARPRSSPPRASWSPTDARPARTAPSTPTGSAATPARGSRGCSSSPRSTATGSARHSSSACWP